jgi:hypothetical protein
MSRIFGQPAFFDYSTTTDTINTLYFAYGNFIFIGVGSGFRFARKNRRYIFSYNNNFILEDIKQGPREKYNYSPPISVKDTINLNDQMSFVTDISYKNSESLPSPINLSLLTTLFKFPSNNYKYFLDCEIKNIKEREFLRNENLTFSIRNKRLKILRYGLLENNNAILIKQTF